MARFSLRLLGPFRAESSGKALPPPDARRIPALLALLALSGGEADKRTLGAHLWPDADDGRGGDSLRHLVRKTGQWLGPEAHRLTTPRYGHLKLDLSDAWIDALAFDDAATRWRKTRAPLAAEEALALYGGPFLQGDPLEWTAGERTERERVRDELLAAVAARPPAREARAASPVFLTAFVGHAAEQGDLFDLLHRPEIRLLTLWGIGGVGKTRLACQLAAGAGVPATFLDLSSLATGSPAEKILLLAADALGKAEPLDSPLEEWLQERLGRESHLLLFDNSEHLDEGAAAATWLLIRCPRLQILATSREPLGVPGEVLWSVAPLPPDEAIALFLARAKASAPKAPMDERAVSALCTRLDGLPLAIELAAAQLRGLTLAQLAEGLSHRFALLREGTGPERHRALEATLAGSWERLGEPEKRLLSRLSLFAGSFSPESVEAVCEGDLPSLNRLIAHSLVVPGERFQLLESVREFASTKLIEREDLGPLQERFRAHYAATFTAWLDALWQDRKAAAMQAFQQERDNLRQALRWETQTGNGPLIWLLLHFWDRRCEVSEALEAIDAMLAQMDDPEGRRGLRGFRANFLTKYGRWEESRKILESLRDECDAIGHIPQLVAMLYSLGHIYIALNLGESARESFVRMRALCGDDDGASQWLSRALEGLAAALVHLDRDGEAQAVYEEALRMARRDRSELIEATILEKMASMHLKCGRAAEAETLFVEVLALARRLEDRLLERLAVEGLALVSHEAAA